MKTEKSFFYHSTLVFFILCIGSLFVCSGCSWFETKKEKSAEELASEGMEAFAKEKYRKATEAFEKLKSWYPFSKFAILAELKIADSHYYMEEYEEAVVAYGEFENLHPRNEAIPYVIYQIGLCYFEQLESIDRDQTSTRKALDTFNRLIRQFPGDAYALKAGEHVRKCKENLAEHEFYVGQFYYKTKNYKAALKRFEVILSDYPDVRINQDVRRHISMCETELKKE
ncbi:outer membrane protein assembly factor BamD [Desulfococcaceae bacterium HSG8]|nr:outer membrane protein assembly factor BamD [Desulfococcaceae bacterium HSG8]